MLVESHFSGFVCIVSVTVQSGPHYSSQTIRVGYDLRCCSKKKEKKSAQSASCIGANVTVKCACQLRILVFTEHSAFRVWRPTNMHSTGKMQFELLELESTQKVHFISQNMIWDKFHQSILYIYIYLLF